MAKAKPVIKAAALSKTLDAHAESLSKASSHASIAVTKKTAEAKKLTTDVKRHTKKKATLAKRVKTSAASFDAPNNECLHWSTLIDSSIPL